jgi:hypothetical protein
VRLSVINTAQMFAFVDFNQLQGNAGLVPPPILGALPENRDLFASNTGLATSQLCLEMTGNNATAGYSFLNTAAIGQFLFENGGGNVGPIAQAGPITPVGTGTCAAGAAPIRALFP